MKEKNIFKGIMMYLGMAAATIFASIIIIFLIKGLMMAIESLTG